MGTINFILISSSEVDVDTASRSPVHHAERRAQFALHACVSTERFGRIESGGQA